MFKRKLTVAFLITVLCLPVFAVDDLYDEALKEHKQGNYKKELKIIEKIERKEGINAKTNLLKYRAYSELEMNKEAKEALLSAIELDKKNHEAHFALAVLSIENGNPSDGRKYFQMAFEENPDLKESPEVLYWYARLCALDNDFNTALEYILSAIEIDPYENTYYLELGKIYIYKKDYIKAVNAFSYAIGKDKTTDAESFNYLGLIQYRRKSYQKARDYFEKAHLTEPNNIMYLHNLMLCIKSMGDKKAYVKLAEELSILEPKTPLDYLHLSQIAYDEHDYRKADEVLTEGAKKFPDNLMLKNALKKLNKS